MAISCEINLHQELDFAYVPGSSVSGVIRFLLDEPTTFRKITVSLKGKEKLSIDDESQNLADVDINNVVHEGVFFPVGVHEIEFNMVLPNDIPPSLNHKKNKGGHCVDYSIYYYVTVNFEKTCFMKHSKTFKKTIQVVSNFPSPHIAPTVTYEEEKKLPHIFSKRKDTVILKANVENNVIESGGRVQVKVEVKNETNNKIKEIDVKLVEVLKYKAGDVYESVSDVVQSTQLKPSVGNRGDTDVMRFLLDIPANAFTVRTSKLVSRSYYVDITAVLPIFYRNAVLKVPIDIDERSANNFPLRDVPPSYWDTMNLSDEFNTPVTLRDT